MRKTTRLNAAQDAIVRPGNGLPLDIYTFDHPHADPAATLTQLLGGKGAGLAEMTAALGINVPPGFTISVPVCRRYQQAGWPAEIDEPLARHMLDLGRRMGRHFGDPSDPLLVAVRSGAPVSMPGMLDTVLNLGLNPATVEGLARMSGDERFAWDTYRRFLLMYATTVMGVSADDLPAADTEAAVPREQVGLLHQRIREAAGRDVPSEPMVQLREAVEAVFRSWNS